MEHLRATLTADARVARIAAAQHGVVAFDQLRAAGLGSGAINLRVRNGRLHRLRRGVFAVGHTRLTREGRWLAAVLAVGDDALLSHASAAALWGLRASAASAIDVTVPASAGRRSRRGIRVHRSRTLQDADAGACDGIAVTSVARTLLDLAATIAPGPLERAVEQSLRLRLFDLSAIRAVLAANPRRRGARALIAVVARAADEPAPTRSELEGLMRDLCDRHGIERPLVNAVVAGWEVDFHWPAQRVIVETDGHEQHGTRAAFERDRARDAQLTMLGYRVVRFTYRQVVEQPDVVAATLVALLS